MKTLDGCAPRNIAALCSLNFGGADARNMRPLSLWAHLLYPRPAWVLSLIFLSWLSGCGPAPSDQAAKPDFRASLGTPSKPQSVLQHSHSLVSRNYQSPPTASYEPLAARAAANQAPAPTTQEEPEQLVLPTWMAQALKAPEVSVRLQALDTWASQGVEASLGAPFVPNVFTGVEQMAPYWSATSNVESPTGLNANKFSMNFQDGRVGISAKSAGNFFWCVRGPMNEASY